MGSLLDLFIKVAVDSAEADEGLDKTEEKANKFASGVKKAGKVAAGAFAATTAAVGAVTGAMIANAKSTASYGDKIDKASQKLGISSKAYQEWEAVLQHSGTSMDSMGASFKKLAVASQNASKDQVAAFEAIGLSMEQVQSMATEDLWSTVISGLQGMEEGSERTALATQLLGKGAQELGPLFNTSAEDTQAMIDTVNELGGVMSEKAVKDSAAFQDALQDFDTSIAGVKNQIGAGLLPVMTGFLNFASENVPGMAEQFSGAFDMLSGGIESASGFMEVHGGQIMSVVSTVFTAGVSFVSAFISMLVAFGKATQRQGTFANAAFNAVKNTIMVAFRIAMNMISLFTALLNGDFQGALNAAGNIVDAIFGNILDKIQSTMNGAKNAVSNGVNTLKNLMNFSWSLPKLKLPHFSISGGFSLNPPSMPKISVDWYAKAMNQPYILNGAQIFGTMNGKALGGGEAGSEMIVGTSTLYDMISDAMNGGGNYAMLSRIIQKLDQLLTAVKEGKVIVLDDGTMVGKMAGKMNEELGKYALADGMGW